VSGPRERAAGLLVECWLDGGACFGTYCADNCSHWKLQKRPIVHERGENSMAVMEGGDERSWWCWGGLKKRQPGKITPTNLRGPVCLASGVMHDVRGGGTLGEALGTQRSRGRPKIEIKFRQGSNGNGGDVARITTGSNYFGRLHSE